MAVDDMVRDLEKVLKYVLYLLELCYPIQQLLTTCGC